MDELSRFRLEGRVALVSGGSGGIGVRICAALAGVGANVAIVGRDERRLQAAREAVEGAGTKALVLAADVTKEADADRVVDEAVAAWGGSTFSSTQSAAARARPCTTRRSIRRTSGTG